MVGHVTLIHTVPALEAQFRHLTDELLPGVEARSVVDESLLADAISEGCVTPAIHDRLRRHVAAAEAAGADAILVTCSSMGPAVDAAARAVSVPLLRVDEPMARAAARMGGRIGVLATLPTTLEPTADLVRRQAEALGRSVEVVPRLCDGAFAALRGGDLEGHDALVGAGFRALRDEGVDAVVLAQASMARVVDGLPPGERSLPVLASPRLGVERLAELLADGERRAAR